MPTHHYRLIDGQLLSRLMRCPEQGGTRHTVRSLAEISGLGKSKISSMLNGAQMCVTADQAVAIAEAVGVPRKAIFFANRVCVRKHIRTNSLPRSPK